MASTSINSSTVSPSQAQETKEINIAALHPTTTKHFTSSPSFPRFKHFPPEIRFRIWEFAAAVPSTEKVTPEITFFHESSDEDAPTQVHRVLPSYKYVNGIPSVLHATQESRHCALKEFELRFNIPVDASKVSKAEKDGKRTVYVNLDVNLVVIGPEDESDVVLQTIMWSSYTTWRVAEQCRSLVNERWIQAYERRQATESSAFQRFQDEMSAISRQYSPYL